ncbi:MAG: hypothetical protein ACYDD4_01115 [Acidimicrobiales bacterium]
MNVEYPDLADHLAISATTTGVDLKTLSNAAKLDLGVSALHAPSASFSDEEFYPDLCDKAAVLWCAWPRISAARRDHVPRSGVVRQRRDPRREDQSVKQ